MSEISKVPESWLPPERPENTKQERYESIIGYAKQYALGFLREYYEDLKHMPFSKQPLSVPVGYEVPVDLVESNLAMVNARFNSSAIGALSFEEQNVFRQSFKYYCRKGYSEIPTEHGNQPLDN